MATGSGSAATRAKEQLGWTFPLETSDSAEVIDLRDLPESAFLSRA